MAKTSTRADAKPSLAMKEQQGTDMNKYYEALMQTILRNNGCARCFDVFGKEIKINLAYGPDPYKELRGH